jgi:hypothetical protein
MLLGSVCHLWEVVCIPEGRSSRYLLTGRYTIVSLLAPMIAMIFSNSRNANLIIKSVFVLVFGVALSLGSKASN